MVNSDNIKKLISDGRTEDALNQLKSDLESNNHPLTKEVISLLSEIKQWKRKNRLGLQPSESTIRRIDLAILELVDVIEKNDEGENKETDSSFLLETKQLDIIIDIHRKSIRRTTLLAASLVSIGLLLLLATYLLDIVEGELVKTILTIASTLIASISGFSVKDINDTYGSLKIFKYFKDYFSNLMQSEGKLHQINKEEVLKIKELVWEATKKTALNS